MSCTDKTIQELLPAYIDGGLDRAQTERIEAHLASCGDCRTDFSLLAALSQEAVPDPGEQFWAAMPGRIERAVREEKQRARRFSLARLAGFMVIPRWTWAAAGAAALVLASWLLIHPLFRGTNEPSLADVYDYSYGSMQDPTLNHPSMNVNDLSTAELDTVDSWAGEALSVISSEAEPVMVADTDLNEDLSDMSRADMDRFSKLLTEYEEEG